MNFSHTITQLQLVPLIFHHISQSASTGDDDFLQWPGEVSRVDQGATGGGRQTDRQTDRQCYRCLGANQLDWIATCVRGWFDLAGSRRVTVVKLALFDQVATQERCAASSGDSTTATTFGDNIFRKTTEGGGGDNKTGGKIMIYYSTLNWLLYNCSTLVNQRLFASIQIYMNLETTKRRR